MTTINWAKLAEDVGIRGDSGSSTKAREAIAVLLGDKALRDAVDYYITGAPGSELARSVLWQLRPLEAMKYCHEIATSDAPERNRVDATELLRVVADERALAWIPELLADKCASVQFWGFLIIDQLVQDGLIEPEEAGEIIAMGETHSNEKIREKAVELRLRFNLA